MKFDIDCAREILLTLEAKENNIAVDFIEFNNSLPTFSGKPLDVEYNCLKLQELGYITLNKKFVGNRYIDAIETVTGITAAGHEYLSELIVDEQPCTDNANCDVETPSKKSKKETINTFVELLAAVFGIIAAIFTVIEFFQ